MQDKLFALSSVLASFMLLICNLANNQNPQQKVEIINSPASNQITQSGSQRQSDKVDFKGVSFNYNPQIFAEIKQEEVAESPMADATEKPGDNYPKHISFDLKIAGRKNRATLKVISIEDYRKMYAVSKSHAEGLDENFAELRKIIKDKNFRLGNGQIPYVTFVDASQLFQIKVKNFPFQKGKGFFFLTQYSVDYGDMVNNEDLIYIYQGISNDEKNYILAEFPVNVSFLPNSYEDYKLSPNYSEYQTNEKLYKEYLSKITKRLNDLSPEEFQPNLNSIEEIISSLKIEN